MLCIGDAAHAMSPAGGVGIDLVIQDAVATARVLAGPLRAGALAAPRSGRILVRIQRRRTFPTTVIQTPQRVVHARVNAPVLPGRTGAVLPPECRHPAADPSGAERRSGVRDRDRSASRARAAVGAALTPTER
ncbi:FAD-dependent monooxygenase [uncultured Microbacterium sp.]|uniref:FAD-dependent monooxygenase n=1 Tax=uncultured Microbacterium sp. TaxID=191216 RepID=UPI0025DE372F|nr:FAD-dependent monooxygenase [uncultured Microbacterium sp.]